MTKKRIAAIVMAAWMACSLSISTLAYIVPPLGRPTTAVMYGAIYGKGSSGTAGDIINDNTLDPGETYYVGLGMEKPSRNMAGARWTTSERQSDGRRVSLVSGKLEIVQRKMSNGERAYFVALPIKQLGASEYDEEGYYLSGELTVGDPYGSLTIDATVQFGSGGYEITSQPQFFTFEDNTQLSLPYGYNSYVELSYHNNSGAMLSMNTDYNASIGDQHPHADTIFLNGNGGSFRGSATMYIEANGYRHFYQNKNGSLTDMSNVYNRNEDAFIFKTNALNSYVISDTDLSDRGTVSSNPKSTTTGKSGQKLAAFMLDNYENEFVIAAYGSTHAKLKKTVSLTIKADLSHLNTKTLRVYLYDQANGKLLYMPDAKPTANSKGLHFQSAYKGQFVITDYKLTAL